MRADCVLFGTILGTRSPQPRGSLHRARWLALAFGEVLFVLFDFPIHRCLITQARHTEKAVKLVLATIEYRLLLYRLVVFAQVAMLFTEKMSVFVGRHHLVTSCRVMLHVFPGVLVFLLGLLCLRRQWAHLPGVMRSPAMRAIV